MNPSSVNVSSGLHATRSRIFSAVLFFCLLAGGIRLFAWYQQPLISRDGVTYLTDILETGNRVGPDEFSVYLKRLARLGKALRTDPEHFVVGVNVAAASVTAAIIFLIALEGGLSLAGCGFAAFLYAILPMAVKCSHMVQREPIFFFFLCLSVLFWVKAQKKEWRWPETALSGLFLALALLSRSEALEWLLLGNAAVAVDLLPQKKWRKTIQTCTVLCGVFLLAVFLSCFLLDVRMETIQNYAIGKAAHYFGRIF